MPALERKNRRLVLPDAGTAGGDEGPGTIRISEDVICAIVRRCTLEVAGVVRFASPSIVGGLAEMIGRKSHDSSIVVELGERNTVAVSLNLVLAFGTHIPEVAAMVQESVRRTVSEATGMSVARVNVTVQTLDDPGREAAPPPAGAGEKPA
jgi:uncharacterized alkaline shock family protein YloU